MYIDCLIFYFIIIVFSLVCSWSLYYSIQYVIKLKKYISFFLSELFWIQNQTEKFYDYNDYSDDDSDDVIACKINIIYMKEKYLYQK